MKKTKQGNIILSIEKQPRINGGPRTVLICKCLSCESSIKIRKSDKNATGKCKVCNNRKRPFESIYNTFQSCWKKLENTITYLEFLAFTKIKNCHYCNDVIPWTEYGVVKAVYTSRAYFLDRKDNRLGYTKDNCVVCCTKCNLAKSSNYSYEDWFGMTQYFRDKNNT